MNNNGIILVENKTNFTISSGNDETAIEYGKYALSLTNINYSKMINDIAEFIGDFGNTLQLTDTLSSIQNTHSESLKKYAKHGIFPDKINKETIQLLIEPLRTPLIHHLNNGYLDNKQMELISYLILCELSENIYLESFNWKDHTTYIPSILINKKLRQHIEDILLKKEQSFLSPLQAEMNKIKITASIQLDSNGIAHTTYSIYDTLSYLMLDLQKYFMIQKKVNKCLSCKRLFYPKFRNSEKYCRLPHNDAYLSCDEIMHRKASDDFVSARNNARGYQYNRTHTESTIKKYGEDFLNKQYKDWTIDCTLHYDNYKAVNDLKSFKSWIDSTKFNKERLELLYQQYENKK